ncbi:MAG: iron(III) transport system substrate-binding protein [Planctomycetota bacterium]|jgi:iron(III) transport system substrate-binding protein
MKKYRLIPLLALILSAIAIPAQAAEVNVYSARKEYLIKPLLDQFSAETGIQTNLITASADKLLTRMINEGLNSPADLLITVDAGRLYRAVEAEVLQPLPKSEFLMSVPAHLKDEQGFWVGLSLRARVIFYAKDRVDVSELSSYEDLANPKWRNRICSRGSSNIYNQSMVASMIVANGVAATEDWSRALVKNFARPPKGGDRDQLKAAAAGQCDLAIANTYYYGTMLDNQKDPDQQNAAKKMGLFWPNQHDRGAHVNVSGAGIARYAKNRENAVKLLEFLLSPVAQSWYASVNYEYPVNKAAHVDGLISSWGDFASDAVNLSKLGELNTEAVKIMDRTGWK